MRHFCRFALALCLALPLFAAPSVSELHQQFAAATLGQPRSASGFKVTVGHATYTLASGTVAPVMSGERQLGLYLSGTGSFVYETPYRDELTAVRYNAKNADVAVKEAADKATIQDDFRNVFLWGNGLPALPAGDAAPNGGDFAAHRALFDRQQYAAPAAHLFVLQALNNPGARLVRAQIDTGNKAYVHVYDDAWAHEETFAVLRRPQWRTNADANVLYTTVLSSQAIGRDSRDAAPANAMLTDLDVALVASDKDDATLTVTETLVPAKSALSALRFDLYKDYIYDVNREPRRFNVRAVTDEQGNKLSFNHGFGQLVVGLAQPAQPGKPVKLRFDIDGNFLYRPEGSNYWELGIEPWFPMVAMHEQSFSFHSLVKVKKPFVPFVSGKTLRREVEGDYNVVETKFTQPVSWVAILAGKYQFEEETRNGVTVRVASFITKNPQAWKQLRNIAFAAIEHYPTFLGPFPFEEINILEKNDLGYGQAPAGIVFITKEAFTPMLGEANEYVEGINMRLAHEIAHQYWGEVVKMPSYQEQWIDEAFAEYSAALFMKAAKREKDYLKAFAHWKADAADASKVTTVPMANRLVNPGDPVGRNITRQGLIYAKGAYLLAALHRELGDQTFLTFLKSYQKSFRWKYGSTKDVVGLLNFITKKDYGPWFEQYFYGQAMPDVKAK